MRAAAGRAGKARRRIALGSRVNMPKPSSSSRAPARSRGRRPAQPLALYRFGQARARAAVPVSMRALLVRAPLSPRHCRAALKARAPAIHSAEPVAPRGRPSPSLPRKRGRERSAATREGARLNCRIESGPTPVQPTYTSPQWGEVGFRAQRGIRVRGPYNPPHPARISLHAMLADLSPTGRGEKNK